MTATHPLESGARAAWLAMPRGGADDVPGLVLRAAGSLAAVAAVGCGCVLVLRRLAGAIDPAGPTLILGAAGAGAALVLVADAAGRGGGSLAAPLAARFGTVLVVAALARVPADPAGWLTLATAAIAMVAVVLRPALRRGHRGATAPAEPFPIQDRRPGGPTTPRRRSHRTPQPGLLRQRFERRELPAGAERVRGRVVVAVPAGARTAYGHLGFCPAFAAMPAVEVTTAYDGVEATVTAAEVLPWGVRVECRLAEPAEEPLEIPVDLVALAAGPTS